MSKLLRLTPFLAVTAVCLNAQTVTQVTVLKESNYLQTSASGVAIDPLAVGPGYGGAYDFNAEVQGTSINSIAAPVITLAAGSTYASEDPTNWNSGTYSWDSGNSSWRFGLNSGQVNRASQSALDTSFNWGTYGLTVDGASLSFNFSDPSANGPSTPTLTLTGGTWEGGKYVVDVTQAVTITSNVFTNFNLNADGALVLNVDDLNINQIAFYSADHSQNNYITYTIPANTLTAGTDHVVSAGFYAILDEPAGSGSSAGAFTAAAQGRSTLFTIAAVSPASGSARGHFYGVGTLGLYHYTNGNSQVRDAVKSGGVIYAVGGSQAYNGSVGIDTGFLWTSTNGLTPLPYLAQPNGTVNTAIFASAITPDGAYIAGRALSNSSNTGQRHAVRVTSSGPTNLDLGYLTSYPQASVANAISSDGSVLYGFARYVGTGQNKAVRFTASGPTITAIPFLNGGDDASLPSARGCSSDGTVMVGTSSNTTVTGGAINVAGNQGFRYVYPAGTVTAIPFLGGGTWSSALIVSPDGNLVLASGNSTAYSGGELFLYNATNSTSTSLGAPIGYGGPNNVAGMTSDGSVVAIAFVSTNNTSFIRNGSGWHQFSTVVTRAGISLTGWNLDGGSNGIAGMSSDGTLVWGQGTHNGATEGWVIEFDPGYLASFGAINDFNQDGKADVLWENTSTGERYLWLMNGTAYGSGLSFGTIPTDWRIAATADVDGDGKTDILWENTSTGQRYLWLMNGTSYGSGVDLGTIPTDWRIAAAADMNGDGKPDIIWENTSTGQRYVWLMNGTAYGSGVDWGTIATDWRIAAAADFNGDGKTDILWENTTTGQHYLWLMNNTSYGSGVPLATIATAWRIGMAADFNGDGNVDILWENTSTGARTLWLMTGTAHTGTTNWGSIPTAWHITN